VAERCECEVGYFWAGGTTAEEPRGFLHLENIRAVAHEEKNPATFFPSPNLDFGYDVSDYTNVAPEYGTLADWDRLVAEANRRGIPVLVDFVVNHTSDQHPWFNESRSSRENPKRNWYVWRSGGGSHRASHALDVHLRRLHGTWDAPSQQWYYHIFLSQQPDVNWVDPGLRRAMMDVVRFWLDRGASGFRLDATPYLFGDPQFPALSGEEQKDALAALTAYSGILELDGLLNQQLKEFPMVTINLEDNAVVRPLMEKAERQGREEGRSEGRAEGVNEGRRQQLLSLLAEKFGPEPLPVNELIHSASVEQLDRWARQLIKANSIEDTLK
jgi:hypothetical protein